MGMRIGTHRSISLSNVGAPCLKDLAVVRQTIRALIRRNDLAARNVGKGKPPRLPLGRRIRPSMIAHSNGTRAVSAPPYPGTPSSRTRRDGATGSSGGAPAFPPAYGSRGSMPGPRPSSSSGTATTSV